VFVVLTVLFRFLFENQSPAHVYYRWKLFSILEVCGVGTVVVADRTFIDVWSNNLIAVDSEMCH